MSKALRSVRRNRIRRISKATGIPMRVLWRAHQRAYNAMQGGDYDIPTPWYKRMWAKVIGVVLMAAVVAWALITMSIGGI